jgi:iron complex outermembrane receptor protein
MGHRYYRFYATAFRARALRSTAVVALMAASVVLSPFAQAQSANQEVTQAQSNGQQVAQAAQTGGQQSAEAAPPVEEVVVSGSRIIRDGYSAPTPVTVVNPQMLGSSSSGNIADYVNTMPAFFGSSTPLTSVQSSSSGQAGLNTLNLRDIGSVRTLVLIDGQRSVGSTTTGLVDINTIPQDLVSRVDVVTGGASAAYGSDALAGVVNFVLDKTYEGTKGEISGGVTSYGDDYNYRFRLTEGFGFDGDRGHIIISGESTSDQGIHGVPRPWNNQGWLLITNPAYKAGNGLPQYLNVNHAFVYTATPGGTIDSGPFANTSFGPGGVQHVINTGSLVSNPYAVGGDWQAYQVNNIPTLAPSEVNNRIFMRASYAITDDITVFGQYSWAGGRSKSVNEPIFQLGNLTIQSNNAFLPASMASVLAADHVNSFTYGTSNQDLGYWSNNSYRSTARYVGGAEGKFSALGSDWTWNAYFQEGQTFTQFQNSGVPLKANYAQAINAVTNPATGQIVCASTLTNPGNGCAPFNVFGTGVNTQAAVNYLEPGIGPWQHLSITEQVWSGSLNGEPFSDWAGPVSIATGVEHRRESVSERVDPYSGGWYGANYTPVAGAYGVTEGFVETVVPLARKEWFAEALDVNAAVRATDYTTAGFVTTWKIGATWDVVPGIRIRGTRSRDIRAPNLSELFQTGAGGTNQLLNDFQNNAPVLNIGVTTGNPNLKPETSDGTGLGVVFQPTFLDNFNFSVDYWEMDIKKIISTLTGQQTIDLCYQGFSQYCSLVSPNLATPGIGNPSQITVYNEPVNLASQTVEGLDFEADYHFALGDVFPNWPGSVALRWIGTHYITNSTNNGLTKPVQIVGAQLPKWRNVFTATYNGNPFTVIMTARMISSGVQNTAWVQCTTGCPLSNPSSPTISDDYQAGAFYLDTAINYNFEGPYGSQDQLYFNVTNIMNKSPGIVTQGLSGLPYVLLQSSPSLYDVLGRTFRVGLRFDL